MTITPVIHFSCTGSCTRRTFAPVNDDDDDGGRHVNETVAEQYRPQKKIALYWQTWHQLFFFPFPMIMGIMARRGTSSTSITGSFSFKISPSVNHRLAENIDP